MANGPPTPDAYRQKNRPLIDNDLAEMMAGLTGTGAPAPEAVRLAQQDAARREMQTNAALGAGLAGAQALVSLIPTAADRQNNQQIRNLRGLAAQGKLGLSGAEKAQMERTMLSPVRALAAEGQKRSEALQASAGKATSAGDLSRIREGTQRVAAEQALAAGLQISNAHMQQKAAQVRELEQRLEYKGQQQAQRRANVVNAIAQGGQLLGQVRAAAPLEELDVQGLADRGYTTTQQLDIIRQITSARTPAERTMLIDLYMGNAARPNPNG